MHKTEHLTIGRPLRRTRQFGSECPRTFAEPTESQRHAGCTCHGRVAPHSVSFAAAQAALSSESTTENQNHTPIFRPPQRCIPGEGFRRENGTTSRRGGKLLTAVVDGVVTCDCGRSLGFPLWFDARLTPIVQATTRSAIDPERALNGDRPDRVKNLGVFALGAGCRLGKGSPNHRRVIDEEVRAVREDRIRPHNAGGKRYFALQVGQQVDFPVNPAEKLL